MKKYDFKGPLSFYMDRFLRESEMKGLRCETIASALRSFDNFLFIQNYTKPYVEREIYNDWVQTLNTLAKSTICDYKCKVIQFCRYLTSTGIASYVPNMPKRTLGRHTPYIFTHEQIQQIFSVADSWLDRNYPAFSSAMVMPCLLRLLYSTGIRIGEALNIRLGDVDFGKRFIKITQTKNNQMRFAPINDSLKDVLITYIRYRSMLPVKNINDPDGFLFVNLRGDPCCEKIIIKRHHKIMDILKIDSPITGRHPRLHDFRHTACVHAMHQMHNKGYDLYNILPVLSKFMGHTEILSTEYYLRLTKEVFPEILEFDNTTQWEINEIINRSILFEDEEL